MASIYYFNPYLSFSSCRRRRRNNRNDSDSSGSDLDDELRNSLPATKQQSTSKTAHSVPLTAASNPSVTVPQATVSTAPVSAPATPQVPRVVAPVPPSTSNAAKAETPSSASFSIQNKASHPLTVARTLLATTTAPTSGAPATPSSTAGAAPTDLMRMVDQTADNTVALWQGILRTYKVPRNQRAEHYSDNKLLLRCISVPWQRLGHQMLQDAHSSEIDKGINF